ncbi:MAG: hypothetical protein QXT45_04210 [Candidatus Bilamarchaeaceae archaeon]
MHEVVWLEHDNENSLILSIDGEPANGNAISSVKLVLSAPDGRIVQTIVSNNQPSDSIRWNQPDYLPGELRMKLGALNVPPGLYLARLIVYDTERPNGIVWGESPMQFTVRPSPLG